MISCTSFSCSCEIKKRDYPLSFYLCHTSLRASVCVAFVEWSRACFCSSGGVQQRQLVVVPPPHLHTHTSEHCASNTIVEWMVGMLHAALQTTARVSIHDTFTALVLTFGHFLLLWGAKWPTTLHYFIFTKLSCRKREKVFLEKAFIQMLSRLTDALRYFVTPEPMRNNASKGIIITEKPFTLAFNATLCDLAESLHFITRS